MEIQSIQPTRLDRLTDVGITSPADNDMLQYNSSTGLWENVQVIDTLEAIQWNITASQSPAEGLMYWNSDDGTLNLGMPGGSVNLQIGQEINKRVRNETGSTILNGTPVYISGTSGNKLLITPADAAFGTGVAFRTYAVATEDIGHNSDGYVTKLGSVRDIDLRSFTAGAPLYLAVGGSGAVENFYSSTPPSAPDVTILIAVVENDTVSGIMDVRITSIPNLNSLSDVDPASLANNSILQWNSSSDVWETLTTLDGLTLTSPIISGSWTWTGASTADWSDDTKFISVEVGNETSLAILAGPNRYLGLDTTVGSEKISWGNLPLSQDFDFIGNGAFNKVGSGLTTLGGNLLLSGSTPTITATAGVISFENENLNTTGFVGLGTTSTTNERLNILMAATDTVGVEVDGETNSFEDVGGDQTVNLFSRTYDTSSPIDTIGNIKVAQQLLIFKSDIATTTTEWGASDSEATASFDSVSVQGDWSTSGGGGGADLRTYKVRGANGQVVMTANTLTTNHTNASSRLWNPQLIGADYFVNFTPTTITSTQGAALYQSIGGRFRSEPSATPAHNYTSGAVSVEYIGGLFQATGVTIDANLLTTSYGGRFSASGSDTNIAIQVDAGSSILLGTTIGDGGTTTYLESDATGNTFWVGDGTGIPHGNMWNHDTATTVTISATNTPTQVPSGYTVGQLNLTTFQNAREIVVTKAGIYDVVWDISFTAASANQEIEGSIMVNGTSIGPTAGGTAHRRISTATDTGSMGGTTTLDLAANDIISLAVTNETSTANVIVEHSNMKIDMVGGT
ncbi:MAG: hypothetical protein KAS32_02960 [Candidatus Peribacteraceae bacterium]|nr:hypothetical protein [Candidatus Peribacteraceae bacterium]